MLTVSPFWRRPLAQGVAVFHILLRLGVVAVAATVRERPRLFVQCYTRTLISMPWDCGQIKRRMPTRAIQGEHTERGVRR